MEIVGIVATLANVPSVILVIVRVGVGFGGGLVATINGGGFVVLHCVHLVEVDPGRGGKGRAVMGEGALGGGGGWGRWW